MAQSTFGPWPKGNAGAANKPGTARKAQRPTESLTRSSSPAIMFARLGSPEIDPTQARPPAHDPQSEPPGLMRKRVLGVVLVRQKPFGHWRTLKPCTRAVVGNEIPLEYPDTIKARSRERGQASRWISGNGGCGTRPSQQVSCPSGSRPTYAGATRTGPRRFQTWCRGHGRGGGSGPRQSWCAQSCSGRPFIRATKSVSMGT